MQTKYAYYASLDKYQGYDWRSHSCYPSFVTKNAVGLLGL